LSTPENPPKVSARAGTVTRHKARARRICIHGRFSAISIHSPVLANRGKVDLVRSVLTRASAAIDRSALRFMERRMAPRTPPIQDGDAREKLIELSAIYRDGTLGHPSPVFPEPTPARIELAPQGDGPLGTQVVDLTWA